DLLCTLRGLRLKGVPKCTHWLGIGGLRRQYSTTLVRLTGSLKRANICSKTLAPAFCFYTKAIDTSGRLASVQHHWWLQRSPLKTLRLSAKLFLMIWL